MKASTLKSLVVTFAVTLLSTQAFAQIMVNTRIDVKGSRYSDQMWVFAVSTCTRDFDNGWDAYKMFGSIVTPQLFAWEANGNFQIDAVPDFNNTYLGFRAGEDSVYTFTFNHEYVDQLYQGLYLVDSVANKTVDIFATGTKYTFTARATDTPVKRFRIVTSIATPPVVAPVVPVVIPTEPVVTPTDPIIVPTDPVIVPTDPIIVPADTVVAPTVPVVDPVNDINNKKDKKEKSNKIKVHSSGNTIVIENTVKAKGKLKVYNALNGKNLNCSDFNAAGTTRIKTALISGSYVVNAVASGEVVTTTIVIP